ncbi:murein biosynthesis integral membrane protein MurJ [Bradyrhizobium sp.]|uniref:murein biosynthesis integral membrane protein MurJ n=1 Tax=Bradyrhizobium sp. TaxID=376 RepID=UPI00261B0294|nr:murein biosynthesis integral membrane protein MurJ [Bradyrhizobium sp.]
MIRSLLTVSTGTLASRLLGFARDAMVAALLGAGPVADAFLLAFQLVNVVRRLLTEGALNNALVPIWLSVNETKGPVAAGAFAGRVLGTVSTALIALTVAAGLLMPLIIAALAPGFAATTLHPAVTDARLMLPYLAFAGPATVTMALLNAQGRFALTAFAPLLFNSALIAVMIVLFLRRWDESDAAFAVATTVGIAGLLQLLILILRSRGSHFATPLRVTFDSEMRGFLAKAIPGMVAGAGPQLLIVAGAIVASSSPSAVSWLYFANRLIELPLGIVGVAVGAVLVPELARTVHADDHNATTHAQSRGLELATGLALPATLGLIALSDPVVRLLFQHGAFVAADTTGTAQALAWLALALPAQVLIKALSPAFFARGDTMTPLWATLKGLAVTIVLAIVLGRLFGVPGIAVAIAFGAWSGALSLIRRGANTFGFSIDAAARRRLLRIVVAALAMGGLLWLTAPFVLTSADAPVPMHLLLTAVLIAGGIAVYGLFLVLLGVIRWNEAISAFRQSSV